MRVGSWKGLEIQCSPGGAAEHASCLQVHLGTEQ